MKQENLILVRGVVADADRYGRREYDQTVEIYEEGMSYVLVRAYPTDEDEETQKAQTIHATVRVCDEDFKGGPMLEVTLDGENPRYIDSRGHTLFAILYC